MKLIIIFFTNFIHEYRRHGSRVSNMNFTVFVLCFCLLTTCCGSSTTEPAQERCNLQGNWYDSYSVPNSQLLFRLQLVLEEGGLVAFALTPNQQWGTGIVSYDAKTNAVKIQLDDDQNISGEVSVDCTNISWVVPKGAVWLKVPYVDHVHVVFMNHLDVGYASFIGNILNEYFQTYFPRAIRLAAEVEMWHKNETFIYTTHPWLVSMYIDCPPNLIFNGIPVQCPSKDEIAAFEKGIDKGHIAWHAGPMNMQIEFMNGAVLEAGLAIAAGLNKRFNRTSTVLSQRDVPGMTMCAIPTLNSHGVKAVSVGVNPGSAPPAVPKIFFWDDSIAGVIGIWHAGGYPLDPGPDLQNAGGISLRDCTIAPNTTHALCFAFRTDNTGPPTSLEELDRYYQILKQEFPEAKVFASTLDQFIENVNIEALPILFSKEIGDTWIQGIASDPRKAAAYRAAGLGLLQCMQANECNLTDPVVANATRFLIKLPEHTWGLPGIADKVNWNNSAFQKARKDKTFYKMNEESWTEQRVFLNLTLEASKGHKLHNYIVDNLAGTQPILPDLSDYVKIDVSKVIALWKGNVSIGFNSSTGSINYLKYNTSKTEQFVYSTSKRQLGVFTYHTYNESDFQYMNSHYDYYGNAGYDKPNCTVNANPESKVWSVKLNALYQSKNEETTFLTHLIMANSTSHKYYGAPTELWVTVKLKLSMYYKRSKTLFYEFSPVLTVDFDLMWINKTATRLPEASMFSFYPNPPPDSSKWIGTLSKVGWDDFGGPSDFNVGWVVKNGSQYQHAVEYVMLYAADDRGGYGAHKQDSVVHDFIKGSKVHQPFVNIRLNSTDVPLICPITENSWTPTPFPAPLDPLPDNYVIGIAYNLHNNIWNTNYPTYYPFLAGDENFRARFSIVYYQ